MGRNSEWDSLCDKCGLCCLEKLEDSDTGQIEITSVACRFLNILDCSCIVYEERFEIEPDCLKLNPKNIGDFKWLPETCAYRRIFEGKGLDWWHYLISGNPETIHEAGISVRDRALNTEYHSLDDYL